MKDTPGSCEEQEVEAPDETEKVEREKVEPETDQEEEDREETEEVEREKLFGATSVR